MKKLWYPEVDIIRNSQKRKHYSLWREHEVRAFINQAAGCETVAPLLRFQNQVVGFVLEDMVTNPHDYLNAFDEWVESGMFTKTPDDAEEDEKIQQLKFWRDLMAVDVTSTKWMEEQARFDRKYLGDDLEKNDFFQDSTTVSK